MTLPQEDACERRKRTLAALGRVEGQKGTVVRQPIEQRQQGRDGVLEGLVQRQELPGHFGPDGPQVVAVVDMGIASEQVEHG